MEQHGRLTLGVELMANTSIMFIDEPTSGLNAGKAAIVMRAVRNAADSGRAVVCTIHQPSTDIFESFDEMILMKKGGRIIYFGQIGQQSKNVISYSESNPGVTKIKNNDNPAAWMLEVTSISAEQQLGIDFSVVYKASSLYQDTKTLVEQSSKPSPGSKKLQSASRFSTSAWVQFKACLRKHHLLYWRSPEYNLRRIFLVSVLSLFFGLLFWKHGTNINTEQDLLNVTGFFHTAITYLGVNNCYSVQAFLLDERLVLYKERFVGMYSSYVYSLFTVLSFTYLGMLFTSISPSLQAANIYSSTFIFLDIFTGFLIPRTQILGWWVWCYWICPASWTLNELLTSQYGDVSQEIEAFGEHKHVDAFLKDCFGFQHGELPLVGLVLVALPLLCASLFVICTAKVNFQKR